MGEFALIQRCFAARTAPRPDVLLGIGDDAAVLAVAPGARIVYVPITRGADDDFPDPGKAAALARRMVSTGIARVRDAGARPAWCTLALTLPRANHPWLDAFAAALLERGEAEGLALVGGDTTRGPATITLLVLGIVDD